MSNKRNQPVWMIPLVVAILVALLGWWGNDRLHQTIAESLRTELDSTLDANVTALEIWSTNQMRMATALAEEPALQKTATEVLNQDAFDTSAKGAANRLGFFLRPRIGRMGYEIAQVVNTNYVVVASSIAERQGTGQILPETQTNRFAELFNYNAPVIITPFKPEFLSIRHLSSRRLENFGRTNYLSLVNRLHPRRGDETLMQVAAPIHDSYGLVIGALALVINPTNEFTRILSVARHGDSGETYAFDQTGLLISESRHDEELRHLGILRTSSSALNLRLHDPGRDLTEDSGQTVTNLAGSPLTAIVGRAVTGTDGVDVTPTRDYRGVPVVGAWRWLPELGIGVATQVDASEAFWLLHVLQMIFVALFLLLIWCALVLMVYSYARAVSERRLQEAEQKLQQLGQYQLEERIGAGSMGTVYRAHHALMRRHTAVKLLMPEAADKSAVERFEREVRLTCQLAHPNTIQIYDYGHTPEGVFYYAMELLSGLDLVDLVQQYGPQPEGRVINILSQVCNSLAEAHRLGLIHRDIKPSNVFISDRGGVPDYVKVLDFGLVRDYRNVQSETDKDGFAGTPWFMAPEMIRDPAASEPRSDLYALGGLAYYLLTGRHVFDEPTAQAVLEQQLNDPPTPPSAVTDNPISEEMEQIILQCLEKDPAQRPASALELAARLAECPTAHDFTPEDSAAWWQSFHALRAAKKATDSVAPATQSDAPSTTSSHHRVGSTISGGNPITRH